VGMTVFLIFIEGPCIKRPSDIYISAIRSPYDNIYDILGDLRREGNYTPRTAFSIFSEIYTKLPRVYSLLKSSIKDFKIFFITPIGVLTDKDPAVYYEECFADLSQTEMDQIFTKFKTREKIYDILEEHYDVSIFCLSSKLIKSLDVEFYYPTSRPALMISDSYIADRRNFYYITMNHFFASKLKKIYTKLSLYDLYQLALEYIAKAMDNLKKRDYDLRYLYSHPQDLFQTLFSPTLLNKIFSEPKQGKIFKYLA